MRRLVRFHLTNGAVSLAGNVVVMAGLVEIGHINYLAANVIGVAVCSLANFVLSDRVVFASAVCVAMLCARSGGAGLRRRSPRRTRRPHSIDMRASPKRGWTRR